MKKLVRFLVSVKKEMGKVKWPTKKELVSDSIAAIVLIIIFASFFLSSDVLLSALIELIEKVI